MYCLNSLVIFFFKTEKSPNNKKKRIIKTKILLKLIFAITFNNKLLKKCIQAYSSVVERTAHNGFVVGSIPTKPIKVNYYFLF